MTITERAIRDVKPVANTRIIWDDAVKGFGLRVTASGPLAFILKYRIDGRERRATIGRPSEMTHNSPLIKWLFPALTPR